MNRMSGFVHVTINSIVGVQLLDLYYTVILWYFALLRTFFICSQIIYGKWVNYSL